MRDYLKTQVGVASAISDYAACYRVAKSCFWLARVIKAVAVLCTWDKTGGDCEPGVGEANVGCWKDEEG